MRKLLLVAAVIGLALLSAEPAARAGSPCTIPASWGTLRGVVYSTNIGAFNAAYLYLEDAQGTIRQIRSDNCKLITEIGRN